MFVLGNCWGHWSLISIFEVANFNAGVLWQLIDLHSEGMEHFRFQANHTCPCNEHTDVDKCYDISSYDRNRRMLSRNFCFPSKFILLTTILRPKGILSFKIVKSGQIQSIDVKITSQRKAKAHKQYLTKGYSPKTLSKGLKNCFSKPIPYQGFFLGRLSGSHTMNGSKLVHILHLKVKL